MIGATLRRGDGHSVPFSRHRQTERRCAAGCRGLSVPISCLPRATSEVRVRAPRSSGLSAYPHALRASAPSPHAQEFPHLDVSDYLFRLPGIVVLGVAELLSLAASTPSLARVARSRRPLSARPSCFWNSRRAAVVFGPTVPSASPGSKPRVLSAC